MVEMVTGPTLRIASSSAIDWSRSSSAVQSSESAPRTWRTTLDAAIDLIRTS